MDSYGDKAVEWFLKGHNCAQATARAFADCAEVAPEVVIRMMAGFGGGVGGQREMCGAVSGMIFALGLKYGAYDPLDNGAKTEMYKTVREAQGEFCARFGSTCCRELLLKAGCKPKPNPSRRDATFYAERPCARLIRGAAEIAGKHMQGQSTRARGLGVGSRDSHPVDGSPP